MGDSLRFWDRLAKKYAASPVANPAAYAEKLKRTQALFKPDFEVLEVGCGTGTTAIHHAPLVRHIRGTDLSPNMLSIARDKAARAGVTNVDFEVGDIESSSPLGGSYDMVMAHSLLHLLRDEKPAIGRIFDLVKPGGWFVSSTACLSDMVPWLRFVAPLGQAVGRLPQLCFFSAGQLAAEIEQAGFVITDRWQPKKGAAVFIIAQRPA